MQPPTMTQDPPSKSVRVGDRIYSLEVKQQPIRARMCGFGDKVRFVEAHGVMTILRFSVWTDDDDGMEKELTLIL